MTFTASTTDAPSRGTRGVVETGEMMLMLARRLAVTNEDNCIVMAFNFLKIVSADVRCADYMKI